MLKMKVEKMGRNCEGIEKVKEGKSIEKEVIEGD